MSPTQEKESRHHDAHTKHRRIIDGALKDLTSPSWPKRNLAITQIFDLLNSAPYLSLYHRARICGLLAKHGDDADVEIAEYALECITHAQSILRHEDVPEGGNAWRAVEDLILDARDTLRLRCPEVDVPEDWMQCVYGDVGFEDEDDYDEESCEDEDDEEEDQGEEYDGNEGEEDDDENEDDEGDEDDDEYEDDEEDSSSSSPMDLDTPTPPSLRPSSTIPTLPLPPNYILTPGYSTSAAAPELEELAFDVDPQNIRSLGLILTLLVRDRAGMEACVLAFARSSGLSEEMIEDIVRGAYVPKRKASGGGIGGIGGDLTMRLKPRDG